MLAAGVAYALDGRPLLGVAICALAATAGARAGRGGLHRRGLGARGARPGCPARSGGARRRWSLVILGVVTHVAVGVGVDWLSTSLFSTPAKVRLAITPATGVG